MTLLDRELGFVAALRAAGLPVSLAESLDAARAMTALDLLDRDQLRAGLAAALAKRPSHRETFDALFELYYPQVLGSPAESPTPPAGAPADDSARQRIRDGLSRYLSVEVSGGRGDRAHLDALAREAVAAFGAAPGGRGDTTSWSGRVTLSRVSPETLMSGLLAAVLAGEARGGMAERRARTVIEAGVALFGERVEADVRRRIAEQTDPASTARRTLRPTLDRVGFLGASRTELAALRRELQPLARRLATRLAQQQRKGSRGQLDFRRTFRSSLASGGVPLTTVHRPRRPAKANIVVLCDVSESVTTFAHFTLLLVYALREQFSRVRAFAFVDELDEVTRFFAPGGDALDSVTRLAAEADVTALSGRTDYAAAFTLFEQRFADVIGTRSTVLVLGDARSNYGDLALPALARLAGRAKHAHWLNPEARSTWDTGDSRATEFGAVVPMVECRNLAQLGEFVRGLAG